MTTNLALDTNAYSALRDGDIRVIDIVKQSGLIGLPIVVLGELYYGAEKGTKKEHNLAVLERFMHESGASILNINTITARIFGEISTELAGIGHPTQQNDIWIAALCKQHDYKLLTADKGFHNITGLDTITF